MPALGALQSESSTAPVRRGAWWRVDRGTLWLLRKLLFLWVRTRVLPEDLEAGFDHTRPVCYVLERGGLADRLVLQNVCLEAKLPEALEPVGVPGLTKGRAVFYIRQKRRWPTRRPVKHPDKQLSRIVAASYRDPSLELQIVPVAIFWGRAPDKQRSSFKLLFSEDWVIAGRFRKFLTILVHGRNTLVQFSEPIQLRDFLADDLDEPRAERKLWRVLRVHYRSLRMATIGPDLSHRRTLVNQVLRSSMVRRAIEREMADRNISRHKATVLAGRYVTEIAADYSAAFIRLMDRLLTRLWNKLYDGVVVKNTENLRRVLEGNEIVYVPCHRSHMDYLLLSYVVYYQGVAVPHIAAGINLNIPFIGPLLRRGGAFYLRRSFKGNRLYAAVFSEYLALMLAKGFSVEYFVEGGRSRTGRLLKPKSGMLAMTVRAYVESPKRPVVFLPVYFGYEKLVEGQGYIGEMSGAPKKRETFFGMLRSVSALRGQFGKVVVSFGEPIPLDELLADHCPDWREQSRDESRPKRLGAVVDALAAQIMTNINGAASAGPVNLLSLILLATPRQAMLQADLVPQLDLYVSLLRSIPTGPWVTATEMDGAAIVAYGEKMGLIERNAHVLGDVIRLRENAAVLVTYFRNNILHLFALPSLLACCFLDNRTMRIDKLTSLVQRVYPYVKAELFLPWSEDQLGDVVPRVLDVMVEHRLLEQPSSSDELARPATTSPEAVQLSVLAQATVQTLERYYMTVALLLRHGSAQLKTGDLEAQCVLMAQRISMLYELDSPEFFDRTLFRSFIDLLIENRFLSADDAGRLVFDERVYAVMEDAELVLNEQIRHSILQVVNK